MPLKTKLYWLTGIIIVILILVYFYSQKYQIAVSLGINISKPNQKLDAIVTTPFVLENITIPYLRKRAYKSNLDKLVKVNELTSYTSYTTSYDSDDYKINGLITQPTGEMPAGGWPAIVFVHGYIPPNQYQTQGQPYSAYVDYLAQQGFVVFKIDLRGHGDSDGVARGGYYTADYVSDTLNAYAALESAKFINPQKIGLWGHSMAGNTVLRSLAVKPNIPVAVIWAGAGYTYTDLSNYRIHDNSYQPQPRPTGASSSANLNLNPRIIYGEPQAGNPFWKLMAPTNYLNDIKGAIQLNHAVDDETVSIEYSRNLNGLLNKTHVIHELNEYPSGGHNITGENFIVAMQNTVDYFHKFLK
jgi:uncharacterized protein